MRPSNLKTDGARLWQSLMDMAEIGATPKGGVCRMALTDLDRDGRRRFIAWAEAIGCTVRIDRMGNIFARRAGREDDLPPVMTGSHLDTVATGGKFDGVLGVLGGLEVLRALHASDYVTRRPIELVVWTNEEGSRFSPAMVSSGVFAGVFTEEYAKDRTDPDGIRLGDALRAIGFEGDAPVGGFPIDSFFELHIEQGPILEREGRTIGVVTSTQAMRWYELRLTGREAHAGPTPMDARYDSLLAAARIIEGVDRIAREAGEHGRGTVGYIEARPNGRNVVTGEVFLCADLRHPDDATLDRMHARFETLVGEIAAGAGLGADLKQVWHAPAVSFDPACVAAVREAAIAAGHDHRDIVSGAGHDAVYLARVAPTAMIFVPCRDGVSHNEAEYASPEDCAAGADVLLRAMLTRADR